MLRNNFSCLHNCVGQCEREGYGERLLSGHIIQATDSVLSWAALQALSGAQEHPVLRCGVENPTAPCSLQRHKHFSLAVNFQCSFKQSFFCTIQVLFSYVLAWHVWIYIATKYIATECNQAELQGNFKGTVSVTQVWCKKRYRSQSQLILTHSKITPKNYVASVLVFSYSHLLMKS